MKNDDFKAIPKIISLVPSATEILFFLGLESHLIGVTENCSYPDQAKIKGKVGTFGYPQLSKILALRPDLVLADGALHRNLISKLKLNQINVLEAIPLKIDDIFVLMSRLGQICQKDMTVQPLIGILKDRVDKLSSDTIIRRPRVFRLMSTNPYVTPGVKSFQYDALRLAGAQLMEFQTNDPYVPVSWNQIEEFDPEVILFCGVDKGQLLPPKCKGCDAKDPLCHRTVEEFITEDWGNITAVRQNHIYPISCDCLCRPGPRLIAGMEKLHKLFESIR
ncbi:ABC-type Fe3+-hydroxamate transport system, periplasmic component [Desulfosporosinus acidiphilus SJ4]|uniref:ABC-type Fe3+-hydroxamate transport system, periplasmic component n=1 Tax=Desulfosporosinus acidiphilus (strain DSM 22704 / JCM 16185 / SJ4) TaxID=646529 RepID=I4D7G0_DESAJ|nr:helical backbone metal receptor [Desulfosporosinus acidiphilus]AFM41734.1 ABC-type Fe3+-hydroxamate transport system, periplasmic component [Desulfosporosinus acidiphilus SJ4]